MRTIALITEYNPFHNGHKLQIDIARKKYGADRIVIVMSGNFTQRGDPAVFNKTVRAQMALDCGADIVYEIPCCFATSGLDNFALGAVSLINRIGSIDYVLFGSEVGDISVLERIAKAMQDPITYNIVRRGMSNRISECERTVLKEFFSCEELRVIPELIKCPNNILGILYIYNLIKTKSKIIPLTHIRKGQEYLDSSKWVNKYASASSIREQMKKGVISEYILESIPGNLRHYYFENQKAAIFFSDLIYYKTPTIDELKELETIYECDTAQMIDYITKKDGLEYNPKLKRSIIHVLLRIKREEMQFLLDNVEAIHVQAIAYKGNESLLHVNGEKQVESDMENRYSEMQLDINYRADKLYGEIEGSVLSAGVKT